MEKNLFVALFGYLFFFCFSAIAQTTCGSVTDIDGHIYNAVQIGSQCWMKENLHVTHFPDGETIASFAELTAQTAAGPFYYSPVGKPDAYVYGHWYNWKAVMHGEESSRGKVQGICPDGWHVPSATEWQQLADYVASQKQFQCSGVPNHIASALAAKKAWLEKPACKCGVGKGSGSTDATGFSAMPGATS